MHVTEQNLIIFTTSNFSHWVETALYFRILVHTGRPFIFAAENRDAILYGNEIMQGLNLFPRRTSILGCEVFGPFLYNVCGVGLTSKKGFAESWSYGYLAQINKIIYIIQQHFFNDFSIVTVGNVIKCEAIFETHISRRISLKFWRSKKNYVLSSLEHLVTKAKEFFNIVFQFHSLFHHLSIFWDVSSSLHGCIPNELFQNGSSLIIFSLIVCLL